MATSGTGVFPAGVTGLVDENEIIFSYHEPDGSFGHVITRVPASPRWAHSTSTMSTARYLPFSVGWAPYAVGAGYLLMGLGHHLLINPVPAAVPDPVGENIVIIKSPMVGTFYTRPNPEADVFVNVGDHVNADTIVCIVEAMKLYNEIKASTDCRIVKILVDHGQSVQKEQPPMLVEAF